MTSIVYDYADIRSRMLGEDKPRPKKTDIDSVLAALMMPPRLAYTHPHLVISPAAVNRMSGTRVDRAEVWRKFEDILDNEEWFK